MTFDHITWLLWSVEEATKAIAKYGAHNQRGEVTVSLRSRRIVWIEEVIEMVEASGSSEMFALLKRVDEKAVTERAYENPVFVEDLVRNVALKLKAHTWLWYLKIKVVQQMVYHFLLPSLQRIYQTFLTTLKSRKH